MGVSSPDSSRRKVDFPDPEAPSKKQRSATGKEKAGMSSVSDSLPDQENARFLTSIAGVGADVGVV